MIIAEFPNGGNDIARNGRQAGKRAAMPDSIPASMDSWIAGQPRNDRPALRSSPKPPQMSCLHGEIVYVDKALIN
jgi:hypothetical protein